MGDVPEKDVSIDGKHLFFYHHQVQKQFEDREKGKNPNTARRSRLLGDIVPGIERDGNN
jgi:hypothetical protein